MKSVVVLATFTPSLFFVSSVSAVSFEWATVGNSGNAMHSSDDLFLKEGYGAVSYIYRMSKYEVTNAQYSEFLNAVAYDDTHGLYNPMMGTETWGGITRNGSPGDYSYAVKPDAIGQGPGGTDGDDYTYALKPVVYVSFFDAMRFANWLENGQPTGRQDASTTEEGVYSISDGVSEIRNPNASFFLPNDDEWYKAAYYDSSRMQYYLYPVSTDSQPDNNLPSADTGTSANFWEFEYTTGDRSFPLTDVGAYSRSPSPYGTFDQMGNVWEWEEFDSRFLLRVTRGGAWSSGQRRIGNHRPNLMNPEDERFNVGFRIASVPEPSAIALEGLALVAIWIRRKTIW